MTKEEIIDIETACLAFLDNEQSAKLHQVLMLNLDSGGDEAESSQPTNDEILERFVRAKKVEGCSERSLHYYGFILKASLLALGKPIRRITTEDIRTYLNEYAETHKISKASTDNIRRVLSSFFSWLEEEDFIMKSPMRRIHKIRSEKTIKEPFSDEDVEHLKQGCKNLRDSAIVSLLLSTGIRVGELVTLKTEGISFERRECVVFGKGAKERVVYFDSATKIKLASYLASRTDSSEFAFVRLGKSGIPLKVSGVETAIRKLGTRVGVNKCHPHRFRRTLATKAIHKGIPIEQVQIILGHAKIETTLRYAIVEQNNVRNSYQRLFN